MEKTLKKYAARIQAGEVDPIVYYDESKSGVIFDPKDDMVPLEVISFGIYQLEQGPFSQETEDREYALVPVTAQFKVECGKEVFEGHRKGGPFAVLPDKTNSMAVYIPSDSTFKVSGKGEMIYFSATSSGGRKPCFVGSDQTKSESRGKAFWRRDIVNLIAPERISTNLIIGETYSPPSLWSGTPLHVHDKDAPEEGIADHEEVYYHLARHREGEWGSYGVQMMFDDSTINKAYVVKDKTAVAIPGAAHPVIAGPVSDMLYIWGLGGKESGLGMSDIPEFKFIKDVEKALEQVEDKKPDLTISQKEFDAVCSKSNLTERGVGVFRSVLKETGWAVR